MRWSLRTRFVFFFIGLAVGPLLAVGAILYPNADTMREQALGAQRNLAGLVVAQFTDFIRARENELTLVGRVRGLGRLDRDAQESVLSGLLAYRSVYDDPVAVYDELALLDGAGREVVRVSRRAVVAQADLQDRSGDEVFRAPAMTGQTYYSSVYFPTDLNEPVTTIAIPLFDLRTNELAYVLVGDVRFKVFWELIAQDIGEGQSVLVLDETGRVVAHNNRSKVGELYDVPAKDGLYPGLDGETETLTAVETVELGADLYQEMFYVLAQQDTVYALQLVNRTLSVTIVAVLVTLVGATVLAMVAVNQVVKPIEDLAKAAGAISEGDFTRRVRIVGGDEIATLARAFNSMTDQLRGLIGQLEKRVTERTRDLMAIVEVGRVAAQIDDQKRLLNHVVNLLRARFSFYQVQVFLLDEMAREAVLAAATGEVGERFVAPGHTVPVTGHSVVARVAASGELVVVPDVYRETAAYRANPLLLDARSEMGVPLRIGGKLIGVLVIQSIAPDAFEAQGLDVFQGMADQIAIAIHNSRLLHESQRRLKEVEKLNLEMVGESWRQYLRNYPDQTLGFTADATGVHRAVELSGEQTRALYSGKPIVYTHEEMATAAVPVRFRGSVIGVLEFEMDKDALTDETMALAQMLAVLLGDSADSTRLFEMTREQTRREQMLSGISGMLQAQSSIEGVLSAAVAEIGRALGARRSSVRLGVASPGDGAEGE
ncbi:MAG: GAF domain-containing protein [Anaerolineae bacterium]|nr:GAF domain-containing protein [Anaerolineae bacterium]